MVKNFKILTKADFWSRFRALVLDGQTDKEIYRERVYYPGATASGKSIMMSKWLEESLLRVARERRRPRKVDKIINGEG